MNASKRLARLLAVGAVSACAGALAQQALAAPRLVGLLLVSQAAGPPGTAAAVPVARDVCRPELDASSNGSAPPPSAAALAEARQRLSRLPASAAPQEHIQSLVSERLLAPGSGLWRRLGNHIGQTIDAGTTAAIVADIVAALKASGLYLADVYLPEQNARDGVLVVVVRPALLGQVIAKGQKYHEARDISCRIRLRAGEPVNLQVLADDLAQLNGSSGWRSTSMPEFQPGAIPGTTDLVLNTTDARPLRFFVGSDNTGTRTTGEGRYRVGVNIGNVFGNFDHQFDYTLTTASDYHRLNEHSFAYQMPLEGRQRLTARLDLTQTDVNLEDDTFRSKGDNQIASIEWAIPQLVIPALLNWGPNMVSEFSVGTEYKRIGSSLAFNQAPVSDVAPRVLQGYVAWRGAWEDSLGPDQLYARLTLSPGHLISENDNATFDAARPGAKASYWRLNATLNKQVDLPGQWTLNGNLNGQFARHALISSERMTLSGWGGVRGYYQDTLTADAGIIGSVELQTPRQRFDIAGQTGAWYALAFIDGAKSWNASDEHNADLGKTGHKFSLASQGLGFRYETSEHSHLRFDIARHDIGMSGDRGWLWHGSWQAAF